MAFYSTRYRAPRSPWLNKRALRSLTLLDDLAPQSVEMQASPVVQKIQ